MANHDQILLVDDDPLLLMVLSGYFANKGIPKILTASDPLQAIDILAQHGENISLVISDIQMPNMDGLEFLRHLASIRYAGEVALVSSVKNDLLEHSAQLAKMHKLNLIGHVNKPVSKEKLDAVFHDRVSKEKISNPGSSVSISKSDLIDAIENGDIFPNYQPKYNLALNKITSSEALIRWQQRDGQFVSPELFIPLAIESGIIEELTFCLFKSVLSDMKLFTMLNPEAKVAVNLEPVMVANTDLPNKIIGMVNEAGLSSDNIAFEVTERSIMNLDPATLEVLSRLRISGYDIAIDDFGTGSSNIQTLRDFPYSELKIDRAFIKDILHNKFSQETVRASVNFARELGLSVVAEGVENAETLQFVKDQGVDCVQGYYLAKPMPAPQFAEALRKDRENRPVIGLELAS